MYDEGMWDRLARAVDVNDSSTDGLQEADYAQLLDDSSALSEAGLTPVSTFLNLTRYPALAPSLMNHMPQLCTQGVQKHSGFSPKGGQMSSASRESKSIWD